MSENREKRIVVEDAPIEGRRMVESSYNSVVSDRRRISGVAITALVLAAVTAAVVIALLIVYNQRNNTDEALEKERAIAAAAQQTPNQPQPPVVVTVPPSQPATVPVPYPAPAPSQPATQPNTAPSSTSIEIEVTSRLLNDEQLRSQIVNVKVAGGTATLTGNVPDEGLKKRAETIAKAVNGVQTVINNITVQP